MIRNTYVIGDVHGALKALRQVLEYIAPEENDQLIFLGDYVDGLPESAQVIDYLIELQTRCSCIFLKGNHDVWLQRWLETGQADQAWLSNGGQGTIRSYASYNEDEKKNHCDFFQRFQNFYIDEEQNLFVHAGFTAQQGPENELHTDYLFNDRTLLETALIFRDLKNFQTNHFPVRLSLFKEIFIGHTPTLKFESEVPVHAANLWDLDTGVKKNGKLTAMNVKTKAFWQSDFIYDLYPEEGEKIFL